MIHRIFQQGLILGACFLGLIQFLSAQVSPDQQRLKEAFHLLMAESVKNTDALEAHARIVSVSDKLLEVRSLKMLAQLEEGALLEVIYTHLWNLDYLRSGNGTALDSALVHVKKAREIYRRIQHDPVLLHYLENTYGFSCAALTGVYLDQRYLVSVDVERNLLLSYNEYLSSGWFDWQYVQVQAAREAPSRTVSEILYAFFKLNQLVKNRQGEESLPYACGLYELISNPSLEVPAFPLWKLMPPVEIETGNSEAGYYWIFPISLRSRLYFDGCSLKGDTFRETYDPAWEQVISRSKLAAEVNNLLLDLRAKSKYQVAVMVQRGTIGFKLMGQTAAVNESDDESSHMPRLSFPLPAPSGKVVLPATFFSKAKEMGAVSQKLETAFSSSGYFDYSYYEVPGGFALVSRLEQIRPDGTPKPDPARWSTAVTPDQDFSLSRFVKALFFAEPGFFRITFFVVTDRSNFLTTSEQLTASAGILLASGGATDLGPLTHNPFTANHRVHALVYEFQVSESQTAQKATQVIPSTIQTRTHLEKSGLWSNLARP